MRQVDSTWVKVEEGIGNSLISEGWKFFQRSRTDLSTQTGRGRRLGAQVKHEITWLEFSSQFKSSWGLWRRDPEVTKKIFKLNHEATSMQSCSPYF